MDRLKIEEVRAEHAVVQAKQRLGFVPNFLDLLRTIRAGRATQVSKGVRLFDNRHTYDVPYGKKTVRVVVDATESFVVTVLPPETHRERMWRLDSKQAGIRKQFYRQLEDDEDEL